MSTYSTDKLFDQWLQTHRQLEQFREAYTQARNSYNNAYTEERTARLALSRCLCIGQLTLTQDKKGNRYAVLNLGSDSITCTPLDQAIDSKKLDEKEVNA